MTPCPDCQLIKDTILSKRLTLCLTCDSDARDALLEDLAYLDEELALHQARHDMIWKVQRWGVLYVPGMPEWIGRRAN